MTYLLDTGVFVLFQRCGCLEALIAAVRGVGVAVVHEVYEELTLELPGDHPSRVGAKRHVQRCLADSDIAVRRIVPDDTRAVDMLVRLRRGKHSVSDLGEAASVALAATDPDLVFVTRDVAAAAMALHELHGSGERVVRAAVFMRRLGDRGGLSGQVVRAVEPTLKSSEKVFPPTWWDAWLLSLN